MVDGGVTILQKVKDINELWSGDSYPSQEVIPAIFGLHGHLKTFLKGKQSEGKGRMFAGEMTDCLERRFPNLGSDQVWCAFANLLNPRYHSLELQEIGKLECIKKRLVLERFCLSQDKSLNDSIASNTSSDSASALQALVKRSRGRGLLSKRKILCTKSSTCTSTCPWPT